MIQKYSLAHFLHIWVMKYTNGNLAQDPAVYGGELESEKFMSLPRESLTILLIANNSYRIAMLKRMMCATGLECRLQVVEQSSIARARLRRVAPYNRSPLPDLVMYDLADPGEQSVAIVKDIAFGEHRSRTPVALLTSPTSERLLDNGEIDGGKAIMFSPRSLAPFLEKLVGPKRNAVLRAVRTFYQYGPFLIRQPDDFLGRTDDAVHLSA